MYLKLCSYVISCRPVEFFHPPACKQGSVLVCISPPSESWLYILLRCLSFKASDYRIDCWQWECFFLDDEVPSLRPPPFVRGEGDDMIYWLPPGITTAAWNWLWQWQRLTVEGLPSYSNLVSVIQHQSLLESKMSVKGTQLYLHENTKALREMNSVTAMSYLPPHEGQTSPE